MINKLKVGILGATGLVGQRLILLLENHPFFEVTILAASKNSAGKKYSDLKSKWQLKDNIPKYVKNMIVRNVNEIEAIINDVDFVFFATNMSKEETKLLEELYAQNEVPVISCNSVNRLESDIPMIIPEVNYDHLKIISIQKKRLGTKKGFIVTKPNCSIQSYVPLLYPLKKFDIKKVTVSTYQALSGAGKTLKNWPEMADNIIPYINGEEEKSEIEPLKIFGKIKDKKIILNKKIKISAQCLRVPVSDGHMTTIFVKFKRKPSKEEIIKSWEEYTPYIKKYDLPSMPKEFIKYFIDDDRPQTILDRNINNGMTISAGRLRSDPIFDYKFIGLSHNTLRGAASGALLTAELLYKLNYLY